MEWHDGPCLEEVNSAMASLSPEEQSMVSHITAERIKKGYTPYLGRAAELLGTEECKQALEKVLTEKPKSPAAANIAGNLLVMGKRDTASATLESIIGNSSLYWSHRVDALVHLKIAFATCVDLCPAAELITPGLQSALFKALSDDDYLVRYHAAEALLRISGSTTELSSDRELFELICGKNKVNLPPDDMDREGFQKAAGILKNRLVEKR